MKLTNIRKRGQFKNESTGQKVNLHVGRQVGRCTDVTFYLRSGKRVLVPENEVYSVWQRVTLPAL